MQRSTFLWRKPPTQPIFQRQNQVMIQVLFWDAWLPVRQMVFEEQFREKRGPPTVRLSDERQNRSFSLRVLWLLNSWKRPKSFQWTRLAAKKKAGKHGEWTGGRGQALMHSMKDDQVDVYAIRRPRDRCWLPGTGRNKSSSDNWPKVDKRMTWGETHSRGVQQKKKEEHNESTD